MSIISALPFDLLNGTTADASQVMANFDEILNDVNNNAAHNGVNTDITALNGLVTPITPAQGGGVAWYAGASTGAANAQVVASPTPANFALTLGFRITFIAGFTNTGALTLNVASTGATAVLKASPAGLTALTGGELFAGDTIECIFDGTEFVLLTNALENGGFGPPAILVSATTTDLGTVPSHNIILTGTATVTSFGATATTTFPVYKLFFFGAMTLVNSSALNLPGNANIVANVGDTAEAQLFSGGVWRIVSYTRANGLPLVAPAISPTINFNYIAGLVGSTAGGTGTMGIAAGVAIDSTNATLMVLASAFTKTTSSWAAGTGNGGLDTGAIATATWYHFFLIYDPTTVATDILFSLSPSAPTMPSGFTLFRRIFSMKTDGSSHWLAFTQTGNTFILATSVTDINNIATTASRVNKVISSPLGVVCAALFRATLAGGGNVSIIFTSLQETDQISGGAQTGISDLATINSGFEAGNFERLTDTSSQIGVRSTTTNGTYSIFTYGWKDFRGT